MEANEERIPGLLARARAQGRPDVFNGKRRWSRYALGMQLVASTDPANPAASWHVMMHNVSGGGLAIWSRIRLKARQRIFIRDWAEGDEPVWLEGVVAHCTLGLRGHMVGIEFADPMMPDDAIEAARATAEPLEPAEAQPGFWTGGTANGTLWGKCAFASATACSLVFVGAVALTRFSDSHATRVLPVIGLVVAVFIGAGSAWWALRRELRFLEALQTACREMVTGRAGTTPIVGSPSAELAALRRAIHDLSARLQRREQDERVRRERLEEITRIKTNILSIVSHDLRTPLTSVLLYAQMLQEELDSLAEKDVHHFVGVIHDECQRLSRLVDDLLVVQRLESDRVEYNLQPHDLAPLIHERVRIFEPLAISKSIDMTLQCPASLPETCVDAGKIAQVINNLISNAIKYTPSGGSVAVSAETRDSEILLCVADNGPGIPREKWDEAFDRFAQVSDPDVGEIAGFGLGLYIVRRIVEAHGGITWLDSRVGRGSAFYVALPIGKATGGVRPGSGALATDCRIVVCDSDPELAARVGQTLREQELDVRIAHTGRRLLQQIDNSDVDIVVTDVVLPDMSTDQLLDGLSKRSERSFRTIVHSFEDDEQDFRRRGVDIVLQRPVSREDLLQAVHVAMGQWAAGSQMSIIIEDDSIALGRLQAVLRAAGHVTMAAADPKEAGMLAERYDVDFVIVSHLALSGGPGVLSTIRPADGDGACVIVLTEALRRKQRPGDYGPGTLAIPYTPGREESLVDAILEYQHPEKELTA